MTKPTVTFGPHLTEHSSFLEFFSLMVWERPLFSNPCCFPSYFLSDSTALAPFPLPRPRTQGTLRARVGLGSHQVSFFMNFLGRRMVP